MKKKYTMEQFEEMFDDAMIKAIEQLSKELTEHVGKEIDGMKQFAFTMQNTMAMAELKKILFKEGE